MGRPIPRSKKSRERRTCKGSRSFPQKKLPLRQDIRESVQMSKEVTSIINKSVIERAVTKARANREKFKTAL